MTQQNTNKRTAGGLSAAPIEPSASGSIAAEFCRIPDAERGWGVKRGLAYELIKKGLIKSVCLRKPGAKTGIRLIHVQSLRDYLNRQLA